MLQYIEGGIEIFDLVVLAIFFRSVFRFLRHKTSVFRFWCQKTSVFGSGVHYGLRIFRFLTFGFRFSQKILKGFRIWYPIRFSVFPIWPIWVPVSLRSERQLRASTDLELPLTNKPIEISQGSLVSLRVAGFDSFACGFRFFGFGWFFSYGFAPRPPFI